MFEVLTGKSSPRSSMAPAVLCLFFVSHPIAANGQTLRLTSIKVSGTHLLPSKEVAHASGLSIGQQVTLADLQRAANYLSSLDLFSYVNYRYETASDSIAVTFTVKEVDNFRPCQFDNFVWLSNDELLTRLKKDIPLFVGVAPPGSYLVQEIQRVLERLLVEQGVRARIAYLAPGPHGAFANLFRVEGVSIPVVSVHFPGANQVPEKTLIEASQPIVSQDYSASFISGFAEQMVMPLYHAQGFLRARFGSPRIDYLGESEGNHRVQVAIPVQEGKRYRVGDINWTGNQVISADFLSKHIALRPNDVADIVQLAADLNKIREEEYGRRGYVSAQIKFDFVAHEESQTADFTLAVEEGDLYRFESLLVQGLPKAAVDELTHRWKLKRGEPYDTTYLREFFKNDIPPVLGRVRPRRRSMSSRLNLDQKKKTVVVILRFK
jgi:outer membrane protein insertion porin family